MFFSRIFFSLTECTEIYRYAMFFCPQISQISQIFIAARWFLSPTDYTDYTDFRLRFFATLKILFCLGIKTLLITKFAL